MESQRSKDSHNSSKPPSTDWFRKPKSLVEKTKRQPGGQPGHPGNSLRQVANPNHMKQHALHGRCSCGCNKKDGALLGHDKRQVFDVPPRNLEVTEHQAEIRRCKCGEIHTAEFPAGVDAPVQYGPRIRAILLYLSVYQLLPQKRISQAMTDLFGVAVSEGTINTVIQRAYNRLEATEEAIRAALMIAWVLHGDETGIYIGGKRLWQHTLGTKVLPQAFPAYVNSRLVAMDNPRDHQRSPDSLFRSFQAIVRTLYDGIYRSLTNGNAKQIGHCLRYPFLRQQLVYRKIQQDRPDSRAVLNRSINSRWKFSRMDFPAFASPYFRLMFRDFQIPWRHIKDLPLIMAKQCSIFFIASTTASSVQRMLFRMIRICNLPQAVSGMTRLAAWLPFSFFNQAFWFTKPIGRRRLAAVMAVFRALRFQFLDSCFKSIKFFYEHLDKSNNRVLALKINSPNFVPGHFDRHANKLIHGNRACLVALVNIWCFITKPPQHLVLLGT